MYPFQRLGPIRKFRWLQGSISMSWCLKRKGKNFAWGGKLKTFDQPGSLLVGPSYRRRFGP